MDPNPDPATLLNAVAIAVRRRVRHCDLQRLLAAWPAVRAGNNPFIEYERKLSDAVNRAERADEEAFAARDNVRRLKEEIRVLHEAIHAQGVELDHLRQKAKSI